MTTLILIIFILLFLKLYASVKKAPSDDVYMFIVTSEIFLIMTILITIGILISQICDIADIPIVQQKIEMYTEENEKIEKEISVIVENYLDHEKYVFDKNVSIPALISLYPELKSDSLVQNQIKIYENNNNQIKSLKTKLIELQKSKFMVYFGKY